MCLRNHQKVNRCPRVDVVKHKQFFIFINLAAGDGSSRNFAKNTVLVVHQTALPSVRAIGRSWFMRTIPLTIRYKNQMEIMAQAM